MSRLLKSTLICFLVFIAGLPSLYAQHDSTSGYQEYEQQAYRDNEAITEAPPPDDGNTAGTEEGAEVIDADEYSGEYTAGPVFSEVKLPLQQHSRQLSDAQWQKMTADKAFQYEDEKPQPLKKSSPPGWWSRVFMNLFEFLVSTGGKVIAVVLISLLLLFIIVRIIQLRGNVLFARKDKKLANASSSELADDYVPDNWDEAIQTAAGSGNYRLALRHSYRYLLHMLSDKELITFQAAKTNYQYVYELAGTQLHQPFARLTRDYEYAWYGGFDIGKDNFDQYYHTVLGIKKELN